MTIILLSRWGHSGIEKLNNLLGATRPGVGGAGILTKSPQRSLFCYTSSFGGWGAPRPMNFILSSPLPQVNIGGGPEGHHASHKKEAQLEARKGWSQRLYGQEDRFKKAEAGWEVGTGRPDPQVSTRVGAREAGLPERGTGWGGSPAWAHAGPSTRPRQVRLGKVPTVNHCKMPPTPNPFTEESQNGNGQQ